MDWLRENKRKCQRCSGGFATQFCHPPKRRPWSGGTSQKASDLGGLMLDPLCHQIETEKPGTAWPEKVVAQDWRRTVNLTITLPTRDLLAIQNLVEYAEHLDPGTDLWAEIGEYALDRIVELEGEAG